MSLSLLCAAELDKMGKKMQEVEECDVPVVTEDFLTDAAKGAALLKIPTHNQLLGCPSPLPTC